MRSKRRKASRLGRRWTGAMLALSLAAQLGGAVHVSAQESAQAPVDFEALEEDRRAKAGKYPMGRRISRYLTAAQEELEEERPEEAEQLLLRLDARRLNPLERANVYRFLAYLANTMEDSQKAIAYFEKVLDEQVMKPADESRVRIAIVQLSAQQEDWDDVVLWSDRYIRTTQNPNPLVYYLKALALYQLERLDEAIDSIETAIAAAPAPREAWLRLLAAMHSQKEDYEKAAPVLEELLLRFPKKPYWIQLSLIYGALEDYPRSLAVQQVAYAQGFLTEDRELQRLARSYLFRELPYPAATVLDEGLSSGAIEPDPKVYELLANSWIAAREYERSLPPLRKAAELSEDGKLYVRLGQVMMQNENWSEATKAFEKAIEKGGLDNEGNADLLLAIAYYNAGETTAAERLFTRAREYEGTRAQADNWLSHLAREQGTASASEGASESG